MNRRFIYSYQPHRTIVNTNILGFCLSIVLLLGTFTKLAHAESCSFILAIYQSNNCYHDYYANPIGTNEIIIADGNCNHYSNFDQDSPGFYKAICNKNELSFLSAKCDDTCTTCTEQSGAGYTENGIFGTGWRAELSGGSIINSTCQKLSNSDISFQLIVQNEDITIPNVTKSPSIQLISSPSPSIAPSTFLVTRQPTIVSTHIFPNECLWTLRKHGYHLSNPYESSSGGCYGDGSTFDVIANGECNYNADLKYYTAHCSGSTAVGYDTIEFTKSNCAFPDCTSCAEVFYLNDGIKTDDSRFLPYRQKFQDGLCYWWEINHPTKPKNYFAWTFTGNCATSRCAAINIDPSQSPSEPLPNSHSSSRDRYFSWNTSPILVLFGIFIWEVFLI